MLYAFIVIPFGLIISAVAYYYGGKNAGLFNLFYWGILPGVPFLGLGIVAIINRKRNITYQLISCALWALAAISIPYGLVWYSAATYKGGGVNIGAGILLAALPIYLAIAMYDGWKRGEKW